MPANLLAPQTVRNSGCYIGHTLTMMKLCWLLIHIRTARVKIKTNSSKGLRSSALRKQQKGGVFTKELILYTTNLH